MTAIDWFAGAKPNEIQTLVQLVDREVTCNLGHRHRVEVVTAVAVVRIIETKDVASLWGGEPVKNMGLHAVDAEGRDWYRNWTYFDNVAGPWRDPHGEQWRTWLPDYHHDPDDLLSMVSGGEL